MGPLIPKPHFDLPQGPKRHICKFGTYKKVLIDAVELIRKSSDEAIEIVIGTDSPNTPGYLQQVKENMHMFLELYSPVTLRKIKSQLFLTKVRWLYFHILLLQEMEFCIRLEVMAKRL
jgi:hypothetical protein